MKEKKLVYGVGINDADYQISEYAVFEGKRTQIWICPYYKKWNHMMERCYSERRLVKFPTYRGCSVTPQWHYFMNFRSWMDKQDWEGKVLDKDILLPGNKIYGPDTCVFVDESTNSFLLENNANRGEWPIGVSFHKYIRKYSATCNDVTTGKYKALGYYENPEDAHRAWLKFKVEQANIIAARQTDLRVAKAIIERYENYVAI